MKAKADMALAKGIKLESDKGFCRLCDASCKESLLTPYSLAELGFATTKFPQNNITPKVIYTMPFKWVKVLLIV
ncbi:hypothetical protein GCM10011405_40320 [Rufibacter glacialis]|nr:hypothetical protein GCM10011405_40320 [Rufibacter glacialis]